ncbi:MAG: glucokinase [Gemmatimonadota bacterium]
MMLLAGDIGGTKTRLGLFVKEDLRQPVREDVLPSADFDSLESLCRQFLESGDGQDVIAAAALGVPGPVVDGHAKTTNLPWEVDAERLGAGLDIETVQLFNDLVAVGRAIPLLSPEDVQTIMSGEVDDENAAGGEASPTDPVAIVAPGTGLGVAYGISGPEGYQVVASEGGHADFAPVGLLQEEMLSFLREKFGRVSYERVCSGSGLPNIYEFLRTRGHAQEPEWLSERMADASDPTPIIVEAGLDEEQPCELCRETLRVFAAVLGAKAGNEALTVVAIGGVYLAGGMPPRMLPAFEGKAFEEAFLGKGRMRRLLERVSVHVVVTPKAPLIGAACLGSDLLARSS